MSSNLVWEPRYPANRSLSTALKFALRKRYGEPINRDFDEYDLPYLEGLLDGGLADAKKLIDAVKEHLHVNVREVY